jgi:hypothetical protein
MLLTVLLKSWIVSSVKGSASKRAFMHALYQAGNEQAVHAM